ncbi:F0F1 ATP synthase subunit I [Rhodobacterales bacterium HKCCE3408]|nr:F0F1 ATP synthase subunit I [Rhodobacterales bacterium HKCCE3408]
MSGDPDPERLRALQERLRKAKGEDGPAHPMAEAHRQGQLAWRMVTELVAGLLIGFGIGYGLDSLLGTRPWLMLIFTILGFVAGVRVMLRSATEAGRNTNETGAGDDRPENGG